MIILHFEIAERFLAYYALSATQSGFFFGDKIDPLVQDVQKKAKAIDAAALAFIQEGFVEPFYMENALARHDLSRQFAVADRLLDKLIKEPEYAVVLQKTTASLNVMRHDWENSLPRLHDLVSFLCDGDHQVECKVFVTVPSVRLEMAMHDDLYVALGPGAENTGLLNLWKALVQRMIQPQGGKGTTGVADQAYIAELLQDLCLEEVRCRLNKSAFNPTANVESRWGAPYMRDLKLLMPGWQEYMKTDGEKKLSIYRAKATEFLYAHWRK